MKLKAQKLHDLESLKEWCSLLREHKSDVENTLFVRNPRTGKNGPLYYYVKIVRNSGVCCRRNMFSTAVTYQFFLKSLPFDYHGMLYEASARGVSFWLLLSEWIDRFEGKDKDKHKDFYPCGEIPL